LTGYKLDMMLEDEYRARQANEAQQYVDMFTQRLDLDPELSMALVEMGFTSLEEVAYVPAETFDEIGLAPDMVELLQARAKEVALADALLQQESIQDPSDELLALDGMSREVAFALAARGIITVDDLADQAIDDIADIDDLDAQTAGRLIMKARETWFN
jgi:N utilization substance protein A